MTASLPFARGTLESVGRIRETISPSDLLQRGPAAVGDLEGGVAGIRVFVLDEVASLAVCDVPVDEGGALALWDPAQEAASLLSRRLTAYTVGRTRDRVLHVAVVVSRGSEVPGARWVDVRRTGHLLDGDDSAVVLAAVALVRWHAQAPFCARCGRAVEVTSSGWTTTCPGCGTIEYPRQDPAVIMTVTDGEDRVLLAHNAAWRPHFWSLLAGFVEAGESLDRAVRREVLEEVGLQVGEVRFASAQPWPFPRSLMLGHHAKLVPGTPARPLPDGVEIDRARFFTREELEAAITSGEVEAPAPTAIARRLLEEWFGAPLPEPAGVAGATGLPGAPLTA